MAADANRKVLVVDDDLARGNRMAELLRFINHEPRVMKVSGFVEDASPETYLAILLDEHSAAVNAARQICAKSPVKLSMILMSEGASPTDPDQRLDDCFLARIPYEIKYAQLTSLLERAEAAGSGASPPDNVRSVELFRSLVGNSRAIRQIRKMMEQVADTEATVLILGESGTGKEVVARNIHYYSSRREKPFVPINCGAIPEDLLESELFGHEKGAFTGAISARQGRFELAEGGTIFLDEIGDMPLHMQVKLLRVIQERCYERVGSNRSIKTDVRIVAATHGNLEDLIANGKFREDLYYRLNVFPIVMPNLHERAEDLPLLINELITRMEHENHGSVRLTPAAVMALSHYGWPGNVRELANLVERLSILHPNGLVDAKDLPEKFIPDKAVFEEMGQIVGLAGAAPNLDYLSEPRLPRDGIDLKEHLTQIEISLIQQALEEAEGVVAHAANRLHMRRTTLVEKMRKYDIHRGEETP
jgi:sigma-54 specific flagellar transcriptional regulator A